jgi:hypothetical protein
MDGLRQSNPSRQYPPLRYASLSLQPDFLIQALRSPILLTTLLPLHYNRNGQSEVTEQFLRPVDKISRAPGFGRAYAAEIAIFGDDWLHACGDAGLHVAHIIS